MPKRRSQGAKRRRRKAHAIPLPRLERKTLHDRAYDEIKKAIMSGAIQPGSTVTLRALASALGTSPMPVRAAVSRLLAERALEAMPTRSMRLPLMTAERFSEICLLRGAIEGLVAEVATAKLGGRALASMRKLNKDMRRPRTRRAPAYLAKNREFHFLLYKAAKMPISMAMIESLWLQIGPMLNLVVNEPGFRAAADHHRATLQGLRHKDGGAVRRAIEADIREAGEKILAMIGHQQMPPTEPKRLKKAPLRRVRRGR